MQYKHEQFFDCCAIGRDERNVLYIRTHGGKDGVQIIRIKPAEEELIAKHVTTRVAEPEFKPPKQPFLATRPARRKPSIVGFMKPKAEVLNLIPVSNKQEQPRVRVRRKW